MSDTCFLQLTLVDPNEIYMLFWFVSFVVFCYKYGYRIGSYFSSKKLEKIYELHGYVNDLSMQILYQKNIKKKKNGAYVFIGFPSDFNTFIVQIH